MKRFISIVLSFMICFMCVFESSTNAYMLNSQTISNEDENVIQSMLEKLETILNLINKTGTVTVECVDEDNNVISNKTYEDLKFGTYTYESPEIEGYELNDETSKTVNITKSHLKQEVNKPLIYIYGGTIDGAQVTFNNCTLNKPLGYILDSYYRDSETNDERFTLNFNNTKFDKDRMLNPDKLTEDLGHYKVNYVE